MNSLPYYLGIGWRYTRASKKSGSMLSFLSGISMLGLVLGIALLIVVLSVMNGFERELRERILALLPQASLFQAGGIEDWRNLQSEVLASDARLEAAAPFVRIHALIAHKGKTEPVLVYGVDYESEMTISKVSSFVEPSQLEAFSSEKRGILIGTGIAAKLNLKLGDSVMMVAPSAGRRGAARFLYMPILGVIHSSTEADQSLVLSKMQSLDKLRPKHLVGKADGLRLKFHNLDDAPYLAMQLANKLGPSFYQNNWRRTHGNLYHAIQVSKNMVTLLMSLIVALAAFNIVSTLILVVTEKQSSVAILRTLGAPPSAILGIFVTQGALIGTGGVVIGVALGCGFTWVLEPLVLLIQNTFGFQFIHSDAYPLGDIPAELLLSDVVAVSFIALLLVFLATIFPAMTAMRMQPAQILRYE